MFVLIALAPSLILLTQMYYLTGGKIDLRKPSADNRARRKEQCTIQVDWICLRVTERSTSLERKVRHYQ